MRIMPTMLADAATILMIISDKKEQNQLAKALSATGCNIQLASCLEEAEATIMNSNIDLLVTDYDQSPENLQSAGCTTFDQFLARFAQIPGSHWVNGKTKILLLAEKRPNKEMGELFRLSFLSNLLAKSNSSLDLEELIITVGKIVKNDIFGPEKYLCYGVSPIAYEVSSSSQKPFLLQALTDYASAIGVNKRIIAAATGVADEFLMNAIYNAPVYANGVRPYARRARTVPVDLLPNETCYFTFASDGRQLIISVRDRFGSLSAEKVRTYLSRCFNRGDDQIEQKQGGAGMGFYFIMEQINKFIINISPGRGTEMIGIMDISGSYKDYAEKTKSFHIFVS